MFDNGYYLTVYVDRNKAEQLRKHKESCAKARKLRKAKRKSK